MRGLHWFVPSPRLYILTSVCFCPSNTLTLVPALHIPEQIRRFVCIVAFYNFYNKTKIVKNTKTNVSCRKKKFV